MKKILVITENINIDDSSGAKANVALIKNLKRLGHVLKVYHLDQDKFKIEGIESIAISRSKFSAFYWLSRLKTFFSKLGLNFNTAIEKYLGFSFSHYEDVSRFKRILNKENPNEFDIIFTFSKAASFRPHKAVLESPNWQNKWYAYIHDPYPMYAYPRPYDWAEPGSLKKRAFFLKVYKYAKHLIYPSQMLAEWMESYYTTDTSKRIVIPHQISYNLSNQIDKSIKPPEFFDIKKFNILHAGSLMKQRPPFLLIKAFNLFLTNNQDAKKNTQLIFIGGSYEGHKEAMQSLLNDNITNYDNYLAFETVFELQKQTTINVVIEANSWFSPFLPGKIPHLVIANKPILHIGPDKSETMRILGDNYTLHVPNHPKVEGVLAQKLKTAYDSWKNNEKLELDRPDLEEYLTSIKL